MKNLALGWACNLNDILVRFPYDNFKTLKKLNTKIEKRNKVKLIINEGIKIILEDIIDNNNCFKILGIKKLRAEIHFEPVKGEQFIRSKKNGKFAGVDFIETLFTGYLLYMYIKTSKDDMYYKKKKPIYFGKYFKEKLTNLINNGKTYC